MRCRCRSQYGTDSTSPSAGAGAGAGAGARKRAVLSAFLAGNNRRTCRPVSEGRHAPRKKNAATGRPRHPRLVRATLDLRFTDRPVAAATTATHVRAACRHDCTRLPSSGPSRRLPSPAEVPVRFVRLNSFTGETLVENGKAGKMFTTDSKLDVLW